MSATTSQQDLAARLRARADQIDRRLGPIPGRDADAIAVELRAAADTIDAAETCMSAAARAVAKAEGR